MLKLAKNICLLMQKATLLNSGSIIRSMIGDEVPPEHLEIGGAAVGISIERDP